MQSKLDQYHAKRNFKLTPEPAGSTGKSSDQLRFVMHKHAARKLHYDFRLEMDGTLKSWAIPKGPSLDPADKRLAVQVEDHPMDYIDFQGDIPEHQYGAGHVEIWDSGFWEPEGDPMRGLREGKIKIRLHGEKLQGGWTLIRTRRQETSGKEQWLLIKERDENARSGADVEQSTHAVSSATDRAASSSRPGRQKPGSARARTAGQLRASGQIRPAELPEMLNPQLATLVDAAPDEGEWEYEIKLDGYRVLARIEGGKVELFTRDGKNWSARLPRHIQALCQLDLDSAWLDGEIVVLDKKGIPNFQLLQNAFQDKSATAVLYFLFDIPYLNGQDLREVPLSQRRAMLQQLLVGHDDGPLRFSAPMKEDPDKLLANACSLSMEGIIGKRADSPYSGARSSDWIKLKCQRRQEFVIAGYTEPQGKRPCFGALLLGVYDDSGNLQYAGRVGTGFDKKILESTYRKLKSLERATCPFSTTPRNLRGVIHWVRPQLVAEVAFAEWTGEQLLRHAVFQGLRLDKPATQIRRETAVSAAQVAAAEASVQVQKDTSPSDTETDGQAQVAGVKITHPQRVIDAEHNFTKLDVVRYYEWIAPHILPFLRDRPVYLLRTPQGINDEKFFQKHSERFRIPGIRLLDKALDSGHAPLMAVEDERALAGAAQMGTVELHACNAVARDIWHPDCMVFDLDPDPQLAWATVAKAARLAKVMLDELGLTSFLKTSGSKGLHIVVPLKPHHDWEQVNGISEALAHHLASTIPQLFSAKMGAQNRIGKVYVDFMRNIKAASTVAPYSLRARPGLPVSTPVAWEELEQLGSAARWNIVSIRERLAQLDQDPWGDYFNAAQDLKPEMWKKLGLA